MLVEVFSLPTRENPTDTQGEEPSVLTQGELTVTDTVPPTHITVGDMVNVPEPANMGVVALTKMAKPDNKAPARLMKGAGVKMRTRALRPENRNATRDIFLSFPIQRMMPTIPSNWAGA
jgi:hypothetical protein